VEPGNYVVLEIADTGIGMTDDVRQRMFEPFFTTKFVGRGLGMAAVLGIVRGNQGALFVESPAHGGTTVRVLFPAGTLASASVAKAGSGMPPPSPLADGKLAGTVLVAEDEDGIRMLMEELLQDMGLKAITVPTGELAVERFQEKSEEISFAILDLVLPGITGIETLAQLRCIRPDLRAVLTSGYQRETIKGFQDEAGFIGFIQKPYDIDTFREVVAAVAAKLSGSR
jgi:CheY-like chemotaxis protein